MALVLQSKIPPLLLLNTVLSKQDPVVGGLRLNVPVLAIVNLPAIPPVLV